MLIFDSLAMKIFFFQVLFLLQLTCSLSHYLTIFEVIFFFLFFECALDTYLSSWSLGCNFGLELNKKSDLLLILQYRLVVLYRQGLKK
jgi:hypothetical protein